MKKVYPLGISPPASFNAAMDWLHKVEGFYSDDPNDLGGRTTWGITERLARQYGYAGNMENLPYKKAREIYHAEFWAAQNLDEVANICFPLALEVFEATVNQGGRRGALYLQRALASVAYWRTKKARFEPLKDDGAIGAKTLSALAAVGKDTDIINYLYISCNMQQYARYLEICLARPANMTFLRGWYRNRIAINDDAILAVMPK